MFQFLEVEKLVDDDLELVLAECVPENRERCFVPCYNFEMNVGDEIVGGIRLRIGENYDLTMFSGHIGYSVSPPSRGQRFASRNCRLLFDLARRHEMKELWITCDENNLASCKTCELAGATLIEIVDLPSYHDIYKRGGRRNCCYRIAL